MSLQQRLDHLQAAGRLPSVVAGVVRGAELVERAQVNSDLATAYRIGSITKTFTAVLVLQLRDEGLVALDDPIGRHLPGIGYAEATLADLLGHTAGLQSEPAGSWWERSDGGDFATLAAANDGSGAVAGAGEYFHYSNLAYGLLGELVARLRARSWWEAVTAGLLEPLAMTRTSYGPVPPHACGHSVEHFTGRLADEPLTDTGAMAPAGQAWSTVADLATWADVLVGRRPDVLAPDTAAEMRADRLGSGYGLGLRLVDAGGRRYVGHTGSMPGFLASLFVDPASGDGTIVLANATTGLAADAMVRVLLHDPVPEHPVARWRPTVDLPPEVADVVGLWFWGNTAIELRWNNDLLEARALSTCDMLYTFTLTDGLLVGASGYHRGETLHVHPTHLECATFIYTRRPYDPDAPIPRSASSSARFQA